MSKLPFIPRSALILTLLGIVSGCGGGSGGGSSNSSVTAPTATASAVSTNEDTAKQGTLTASDRENDPLTYSIVSNGSKGTATVTDATTGAFIYTPAPDTNGTDIFSFKANDGSLDSNTATVTVTIVAINDAPVAQVGSLAINEDTPGSGTLVATDPESQPLTYSIVTNGTNGTATITNPTTGAFVYTPAADANGIDTFSFRASDGSLNSNTATVAVTILAVEDAPVAQAGNLATNEDTPGSGTLVATDAESQPLTYSIVSNGATGTATISNPSTGAYTYTPDPGTNGSDTFTFRANDGLLNSNVATVTVTVNAAPVATGSCGTTPQAQTLASVLSATDAETPGSLIYSLNADGSGGTGPIVTATGGTVTITDQTTGAFTYQPSTAAGDRRGTDTFDYRVIDPDGNVDSATETVIVDQAIMPLGDSITEGYISATVTPTDAVTVGFRKPLYEALDTDGFTFDFVGTSNEGTAAVPPFDVDNEGHGGYTAFDIAWGLSFPSDGVFAWLETNPADIVLLHAGTNQIDANTYNDVKSIIDEIDRWEASANGNPVTVVLAKIIDRVPANADVTTLNNNIQTFLGSRSDIVIVNQHDALNYASDMEVDGIHPKQSGYNKMSTVWFNALTNLVDKCP